MSITTPEVETPTLATVLDAARKYPEVFKTKTDREGKIINRSTAYDVFRRLPDHLKRRVGATYYLSIPAFENWVVGEDRRAA